MTDVRGTGEYVLFDGFIALRDTDTAQWIVSRVTANANGDMALTYLTKLTYMYEVEAYIREAS